MVSVENRERHDGRLLLLIVVATISYTTYRRIPQETHHVKTQGQGQITDASNKIKIYLDEKSKIIIPNNMVRPSQTVNQTIETTQREDNVNTLTNAPEQETDDPNLSFSDYFDDFHLRFDKEVREHGPRHENETFKAEYEQMSDYWKSVSDGIGANGKLYQNDFDVDGVLQKLQTSKILNISFLFNRPTIKWILTLEGGQKALFKPHLNVKKTQHCKSGCEHPEYEIAGFTINRMLGLNTMPFTTGRTLDWFNEIEPIASKDFSGKFSTHKRSSDLSDICVKWKCRGTHRTRYCFSQGRIFGSIMYWVNGDIVEIQRYSVNKQVYIRRHPMYFSSSIPTKKAELLGIGDTRLCDKVRQMPPYDEVNSFLYILDMAVEDFLTQSKNSKHNVLYLNSSNKTKLDVVIDKGKGFCPFENDLLLAPIYQCCMIRRSVYEALKKMEHTFIKTFQDMIMLQKEILSRVQLHEIESRVTVILDYVQKCFELKGRKYVLIDM